MSEFSHLKNKLLAEQVEDQIYHYILDEALEPGAKLPNEFALGEKFRVGRSTIREAVKLVASKGIVEVRQGSGTYVVTTVKGLSDPLNLRSVQDKNALAFDLVNVRLLLEPGIAEMAAQNATPEDIERLRRLCERVETKIHEGDRYIEDDIAFHTCIAESSSPPGGWSDFFCFFFFLVLQHRFRLRDVVSAQFPDGSSFVNNRSYDNYHAQDLLPSRQLHFHNHRHNANKRSPVYPFFLSHIWLSTYRTFSLTDLPVFFP